MTGKQHSQTSKDKFSNTMKKLWSNKESNYHKRPSISGKNNPMFGKTPSNAISILFNEVLYSSITAASRATGISIYWIKKSSSFVSSCSGRSFTV